MYVIYNRIKLYFYIIGFVLTAYSILKFGIDGGHIPTLGFFLPVFLLLLGIIWGLIDIAIVFFSKSIKINYSSHYYGIGINFLIVISILIYTVIKI